MSCDYAPLGGEEGAGQAPSAPSCPSWPSGQAEGSPYGQPQQPYPQQPQQYPQQQPQQAYGAYPQQPSKEAAQPPPQYHQPQYHQPQPQPQPQQPRMQQVHTRTVVSTATTSHNFDTSICDFDDTDACCDVLWCTPCTSGRLCNAACYGRGNSMNIPVALSLTAALVSGNVGYCLLLSHPQTALIVDVSLLGLYSLGLSLLTCQQRSYLRDRVGVDSNDCEDCLLSFFCTQCTMCHLHRESRRAGLNPGYTLRGCGGSSRTTVVVSQQQTTTVQPTYIAAPVVAQPVVAQPVYAAPVVVAQPPMQQQSMVVVG